MTRFLEFSSLNKYPVYKKKEFKEQTLLFLKNLVNKRFKMRKMLAFGKMFVLLPSTVVILYLNTQGTKRYIIPTLLYPFLPDIRK